MPPAFNAHSTRRPFGQADARMVSFRGHHMPDEAEQSQLDRIEALCVDTKQELKRVSVQMFGNGQPERGHVIRMDRLEVRGARTDRWQGAVITTVVLSLVAGVTAVAVAIIKDQT